MPRVSVLMSTYNVADFVAASVMSILSQTYQDFEILIVDDASTDNTWEVLQSLAGLDNRIALFRNPTTLGVPGCINRLAREARGEYIARMDADDISTPGRFALQVAVLDAGECDLCGGAFIEFPAVRPTLKSADLDDAAIRISLLFEWTLMLPTVMMRAWLLQKEHMRSESVPAADYDLWVRLARIARLRNLPDVLLLKREHAGQISARRVEEQARAAARARRMALEDAGIVPDERELDLHCRIWGPREPDCWQDVADTEAWLVKLASALQGRPGAAQHISRRWYRYCLKSAPHGLKVYRLFRRSSLHRLHPCSAIENVAILVTSLLRVRYQSRLYSLLYSLRPGARRSRNLVASLPRDLRAILAS